MKKNNKIGLIVIPIVVLGGISFALFQFEDTLSFQPENELDDISLEHSDTSTPFQLDDILSFDREYDEMKKTLLLLEGVGVLYGFAWHAF